MLFEAEFKTECASAVVFFFVPEATEGTGRCTADEGAAPPHRIDRPAVRRVLRENIAPGLVHLDREDPAARNTETWLGGEGVTKGDVLAGLHFDVVVEKGEEVVIAHGGQHALEESAAPATHPEVVGAEFDVEPWIIERGQKRRRLVGRDSVDDRRTPVPTGIRLQRVMQRRV